MEKQKELEILQDAAEKLGYDSYCGPWLRSILAEVKRDMQSDFAPAYTIDEARRLTTKLVNDATIEAEEILSKAHIKANTKLKAAEDRIDKIMQSAATAVNRAQHAINNY